MEVVSQGECLAEVSSHNQITSRGKEVSVVAVVTASGCTVFVGASSGSSNLVHGAASDSLSVVGLNAGLAAVVATTIRELSDLVTAVVSVSSSRSSLSC